MKINIIAEYIIEGLHLTSLNVAVIENNSMKRLSILQLEIHTRKEQSPS